MEFLIELIFDIIFEGSLELSTSRRVPLPLRIFAALILLIVYGGIVVILGLLGVDALRGGKTHIAFFFFVVDLFIIFLAVWAVRKKYKENNSGLK